MVRPEIKFSAVTSAVPILGWMVVTMAIHTPLTNASPPSLSKQVSVVLLGSAEEITGINVPKGIASERNAYLRLQESADVTVKLPGSREVRMRVKYISVNLDRGVVVDVHLLPLSQAVSFREALAEL